MNSNKLTKAPDNYYSNNLKKRFNPIDSLENILTKKQLGIIIRYNCYSTPLKKTPPSFLAVWVENQDFKSIYFVVDTLTDSLKKVDVDIKEFNIAKLKKHMIILEDYWPTYSFDELIVETPALVWLNTNENRGNHVNFITYCTRKGKFRNPTKVYNKINRQLDEIWEQLPQ